MAITNRRFRGAPLRGLEYFGLVHETIQHEPVNPESVIFNTYRNTWILMFANADSSVDLVEEFIPDSKFSACASHFHLPC